VSEIDEKKLVLLESGPEGLRKPKQKRRLSKATTSEQETSSPKTFDFSLHKDDEADTSNVIFRPNPGPQTTFLSASELEVLYGGSAGGGKSYGILADALRDMPHPQFRGLLVRKTTEELRELVQKSQELYPKAIPGIKWSERKMEWLTPSGGRLWMSFLERDQDVTRYQGQAFNYIAFDELTQWATPFCWNYMRSRLRTTAPDLKLYMRACVDEGDVLTETGWKDISEVKVGEYVQSLTEDGQLVKRKVTGVHVYDVDEDLVRVRKKNLFMSMTPDHRVVYKKFGSDKKELVRFNEHVGRSISVVRSSSEYVSQGYDPKILNFDQESYAEFLGLYIAEGCVTGRSSKKKSNKVLITQNKSENHIFVRKVMEASGCNVCYSKNGDFQITNKLLYEHLAPLGKAPQKHFPREFLDKASKKQLLLAFNAYALGDGHWQSETSVSLFTCSKQLSDDLQEIAVKLGYKTQVTFQALDNVNHNDKYIIYVSLREPVTKVDKNDVRNDVSYEPYTGKVYCLSVEETENFVLRQKGYVWVSGNTSNPGNIGHSWVKKAFIDPAPWGKPFDAVDPETGDTLVYPELTLNPITRQFVPHPKAGQPLFKRRFIPASLVDNPYLAANGEYEAMLMSLPEAERKRLLEGDWDVNEGAAFPEWNRAIHVVEPFEIPHSWRRFRACDYGYGSKSAVLWFAITPAEQLVVYRELYVSKVLAVDLAKMIEEIEDEDGFVSYGILDSSLWHKRGDRGPVLADQLSRPYVKWRPSDRSKGSRVAGKNELHRRLQVDPFYEEPRIVFFSTCTNTIAQLPTLPLDPDNPEDVYTKAEDHIYDALRYGIMSRPRSHLNDNTFGNTYKPADSVFGY